MQIHTLCEKELQLYSTASDVQHSNSKLPLCYYLQKRLIKLHCWSNFDAWICRYINSTSCAKHELHFVCGCDESDSQWIYCMCTDYSDNVGITLLYSSTLIIFPSMGNLCPLYVNKHISYKAQVVNKI